MADHRGGKVSRGRCVTGFTCDRTQGSPDGPVVTSGVG